MTVDDIYTGYHNPKKGGAALVFKNDKMLDPKPSQKITNHSPDGFNFGYSGSGPAQLALALLLDATGNVETAQRYYQHFKQDHVAHWRKQFTITKREILMWLEWYKREYEGVK